MWHAQITRDHLFAGAQTACGNIHSAPNMLETLRTVVGHVHAVHVYIISLSKQNKNGRSNGSDNQQIERIQTYGKTLEMCWNRLRSLLLSLMNVVQKRNLIE